MSTRSNDLLTGQLLADKYQVGELLGEGGFAQVYEARHLVLEHRVALKVIRPEWASRGAGRARFAAEARLCARVDHPNIIRVLDVVDSGAHWFLVLELIDGRSLRRRIADSPPQLGLALDWIDAVLCGLEAAHARDVIHGDIKPSNILIGADDREVKLIDFGAAERTGYRPAASVYGTPQYMAPETTRGAKPSAAEDIYGSGVLLYELLCGHLPFLAGNTAELHRAHAHQPVEMHDDERVQPIIDVAKVALAKRPEQRFTSAAAMRKALRAARARLRPRTCRASTSDLFPTVITGGYVEDGCDPEASTRVLAPVAPAGATPHGS